MALWVLNGDDAARMSAMGWHYQTDQVLAFATGSALHGSFAYAQLRRATGIYTLIPSSSKKGSIPADLQLLNTSLIGLDKVSEPSILTCNERADIRCGYPLSICCC
jgi:hypothetical protein